ncbi:fatty acid desaturase family protein [Haliangium sp.]|uniref:fatty acid desaturase family protein n=1 Tax=Haliangium sp. TaxID=2663208 RepID=UPI003D103C06
MSQKRPRIPAHMHKISVLGSLGIIAHALALFLVPAVLVRLIVGTDWPLALQAALVVPLALLAAQGLHMLAFLGHEGFHFSLHSNKVVSSIIGVLFSSMVPGHLDIGFAISHWNHHKFTNRSGDPDALVFRRYHSFLARLLLARLHAVNSYLANSIRLALGRPLPFAYKFPLKPDVVQKLAWLNLATSLGFLTLYAAIAIIDPLTGLVSIGLPAALVIFITGVRPYIEHAGTGHELLTVARTRTSWFFTALFLGTNYHLEHHLYPSVPCYRLPQVHRLLREQGVLADAHVEDTVLGAYAHTTSRSQYPQPLAA